MIIVTGQDGMGLLLATIFMVVLVIHGHARQPTLDPTPAGMIPTSSRAGVPTPFEEK
jgi:hypothetical protein